VISESNILDGVFKLFIGLLAWLGIRLHKRVDALGENKLSKSEATEMKDLMKEHRDETRSRFDAQDKLLNQILFHLPKD